MQLSAISLALTRAGYSIFTPSSIFTSGVNGAWYDPSDITTLYRDAAGTLPVTAVEQPVGLMLDKSKNGVGTNGAKRVNLLTKTEQFDDGGAWTTSGGAVSANATTAPDGTTTADLYTLDTSSNAHGVVTNGSTTSAGVFSIYMKSDGQQWVRIFASGSDNQWFDIKNGVKGTTGGAQITAASISAVTGYAGWYKLSITVTTSSGLTGFRFASADNNSSVYTGNGTDSAYIWGADLRVASEASTLPTYQKITDTWYNTLPGNHAFNSSGNSANFPVLSARYNLLTKTEDFSDAAWSKYNVTVTPNTTIAPDGTNTADTFTTTSSVSALYLSAFTSLGPSKWSIRAKPGTSRYIALIVGNDRGDQGYVVFDIQDGVVGQTGNGIATTLVSGSITPSSQGFFVCTMSYTRTTSGNCKIELAPTLTGNTFDSSGEVIGNPVGSSAIIWGADLRVANDALNQPAYQRVNTATDYDTVGFKPYLKFNGTNQWLQTNSIDFTYGDKMFVSAGVRKLSDAAVGVIAELSATADTNNGSFAVFNESGSGKTGWGFFSKGTAFGTAAVSSGYTAPITSVLSGTGNIAGDSAILRINGAQAAINTADQGTGNYGNYPMFVGARAGTSLWFNGRLYSLIVAGKLANAVEITETEKYVNSKTAAY